MTRRQANLFIPLAHFFMGGFTFAVIWLNFPMALFFALPNAVAFIVPMHLCPPIIRKHSTRLRLLTFILGAIILGGELLAIFAMPHGARAPGWWIAGSMLVSAVLGTIVLRLAFYLGYLRRYRGEGNCEHCGYDLRGSPGPTCPECGASIVR